MVTIEVLRPFYDLTKHRHLVAGETFEATEERAAQIDAALPGYVSVTAPVEEAPDYARMTNPQLVNLCRERGIVPPKRAKKADLVALLTEE